MRRLSNSSLPASVSKNHWPSCFTMGTGKGQKLSPTSSTHLESDSRTIRLAWLSAVVNARSSLVACTRSGFCDLRRRWAKNDPEGVGVFRAGGGRERRNRLFGRGEGLADVRRAEGDRRAEGQRQSQVAMAEGSEESFQGGHGKAFRGGFISLRKVIYSCGSQFTGDRRRHHHHYVRH